MSCVVVVRPVLFETEPRCCCECALPALAGPARRDGAALCAVVASPFARMSAFRAAAKFLPRHQR